MGDTKTGEQTPMFRQYAEQKARHKDAVLFFRMGDFYEMFHSDAVEVSRLLNLTLTQRQGIPMCGIPYHAAGNYIPRLLNLGKKVAICEQIEMPHGGKGLAHREVVEVVTPGTVVEDAYLDERTNNYLAALASLGKHSAFGYIDLSTSEFKVTLLDGQSPHDALRRELAKTSPKEMVIQESLLESSDFAFLMESGIVLNRLPDWCFQMDRAEDRLKRQFGTISLRAFGLNANDPRTIVSGVLLDYLEDNHKGVLHHVQSLACYTENDAVGLDESTIRNLELIRNLTDGGTSHTLLHILDHTKTAAGARALRRRLLQPWPYAEKATESHARVEKLYRNQPILVRLRAVLSGTRDIERLSARAAMDRAHAKDLVAIRDTLKKTLEAREILDDAIWGISSKELDALFQRCSELMEFLASALMDDPSILLTEGRLIRDGWNEKIDHMRAVQNKGRQLLDDYIVEEKASTGFSSLKLKYNRLLGYFIEISKNQATGVPERYRRRQSLTQIERFSTVRLEELESEISSAGERLVESERTLFLGIRKHVKEMTADLLRMGSLLADIDLIQSFAHAATVYGYIRPTMTDEVRTEICGGRHPVVEQYLPRGSFVPNSVVLKGDDISFAMVTGPNMAGKSTVLRQVALITLMAQAGSFVPADSALIGTTDKIFCRVGASDNLARGESTFLVEMNETANILRNTTPRSLVIMDEVGRGTGTADGLAIARAVCEYLLEHHTPRTFFATHYRELTKLNHSKMQNFSMAVEDNAGHIVFPKTLIEGPATASYGIHVAALAGMPAQVVERARALVNAASSTNEKTSSNSVVPEKKSTAPMLFSPQNLIVDTLSHLDINALTPLEALKLLDRWKNDLNS